LHVSESPLEQNETVYVELKVDSSPAWMSQLADRMNISTDVYQAQVNYFQSKKKRTRFRNTKNNIFLLTRLSSSFCPFHGPVVSVDA